MHIYMWTPETLGGGGKVGEGEGRWGSEIPLDYQSTDTRERENV